MEAESDNIQVLVRLRPLNEREKNEDARSCVIIDDINQNSLILDSKAEQKKYVFDYVAGENATQEQIFCIVGKPLTAKCLSGYNGCIFAYGQTGAGKTYTMQGKGIEKSNPDCLHRGLQLRVFEYLFACIRNELTHNNDGKCLVKCTYLEIYNEQIMDLLTSGKNNLQIREDLKKGVYVEGLVEEQTQTAEETLELLKKGARNRHVGATQMNFESSRSHSVFSITIEMAKNENGVIKTKCAKLHFVDLAGSERQKQTSTAGERLKEATNINKSLTVLGCVINSLVEICEGKNRHIRYRDSKLTFLLKDSLGGNSKTFMIANISSASTQFSETLSTLKFAQRAKMIKNKASINEEATGNIEDLKKEIKRLKSELDQSHGLIKSLEFNKISMGDINQNKLSQLGFENQQCINTNILEQHQQYMIQQTKKYSEIEDFIKLNVDSIMKNFSKLSNELIDKDEYINMYKLACDALQYSEIQYRTTIQLQDERIKRLKNRILQEGEKTEDEIVELLDQDYINIRDLLEQYSDLLSKSPTIAQILQENISYKEKLDKNQNNLTNTNLIDEFKDNLIFIKNLGQMIEQSMKERSYFEQKLEKMGLIKTFDSNVSSSEDNITLIKIEQNQQIEKLNSYIIELKQRIIQLERGCQQEKKKNKLLTYENENYQKDKIQNKIRQENRLENMAQKLVEITKQFENVQDIDSVIMQLNLKLIETEEKLQSSNHINEGLKSKLHETEILFKQELSEKEIIMMNLPKKMDQLSKEKALLQNSLKTTESNMQCVLQELTKSKEDVLSLNEKLVEMYNDLELSKCNLENQVVEKIKLQQQILHINEEQQLNKIILELQTQLEAVNSKNHQIQLERQKIQDELDTFHETFNFKINEIEEQKNYFTNFITKVKETGGEQIIAQVQNDLKCLENQTHIIDEGQSKIRIEISEEKDMINSNIISQLQEDFSKKSDQCLELQRKLEQLVVELCELSKENQDITQKNIVLQERLEKSQDSLKTLEEERETLKNKLRESVDRVLELQYQVSENLDQIQNLSAENTDYKEKIEQIEEYIQENISNTTLNNDNSLVLDDQIDCNNIIDKLNLLMQESNNRNESVIEQLKQIIYTKNINISQLEDDLVKFKHPEHELNGKLQQQENQLKIQFKNEIHKIEQVINQLIIKQNIHIDSLIEYIKSNNLNQQQQIEISRIFQRVNYRTENTKKIEQSSIIQNQDINQVINQLLTQVNTLEINLDNHLQKLAKEYFNQINNIQENKRNEEKNNIQSSEIQILQLDNQILFQKTQPCLKDEVDLVSLKKIQQIHQNNITQSQNEFLATSGIGKQQQSDNQIQPNINHQHQILSDQSDTHTTVISEFIQEPENYKIELNETLKIIQQNNVDLIALQNKLSSAENELAENEKFISEFLLKLEQQQNNQSLTPSTLYLCNQLQAIRAENQKLKDELKTLENTQQTLQIQIEFIKELELKNQNLAESLQIKEKEYFDLHDKHIECQDSKNKLEQKLYICFDKQQYIQHGSIVVEKSDQIENIVSLDHLLFLEEEDSGNKSCQFKNLQEVFNSVEQYSKALKKLHQTTKNHKNYQVGQQEKTDEYFKSQFNKQYLENQQYVYVLEKIQVILQNSQPYDLIIKELDNYSSKLQELCSEFVSDKKISNLVNAIKLINQYLNKINNKYHINNENIAIEYNQTKINNIEKQQIAERLKIEKGLNKSKSATSDENQKDKNILFQNKLYKNKKIRSILDASAKIEKRKAQGTQLDELKKKIKVDK